MPQLLEDIGHGLMTGDDIPVNTNVHLGCPKCNEMGIPYDKRRPLFKGVFDVGSIELFCRICKQWVRLKNIR